jgi:pimeloyl-ACP methyl ester carboxylesterase
MTNIVLVHGAWADGSCWSATIERLQSAGHTVTAPQFALGPLEADVARLRSVLARQPGPTVLAGHSYGGAVISGAATGVRNAIGL